MECPSSSRVLYFVCEDMNGAVITDILGASKLVIGSAESLVHWLCLAWVRIPTQLYKLSSRCFHR